jgi:hypothetical protein
MQGTIRHWADGSSFCREASPGASRPTANPASPNPINQTFNLGGQCECSLEEDAEEEEEEEEAARAREERNETCVAVKHIGCFKNISECEKCPFVHNDSYPLRCTWNTKLAGRDKGTRRLHALHGHFRG